jgi:hypothetical protein
LLFLAGMMILKGALPQTMIWWLYSIPFLLDFIGFNFANKGTVFMFSLVFAVDFLYMLNQFRVCRILTHFFMIWIFVKAVIVILSQRHDRHYKATVDE